MLDSRGNSVATLLMLQGAESIENFDFQSLDIIVKQAHKDSDLQYIAFFDENGQLLSGDKSHGHASNSRMLMYNKKLAGSDGKYLGEIKIGYYSSSLERTVRNTALIMAAGLAMTLLLFVLGMSLLIRLLVTERVSEAANMLEDMAEGRGDLTHRLKLSRYNDEINHLATCFNTFMDNLQEMVRTIQDGVGDMSSSSS